MRAASPLLRPPRDEESQAVRAVWEESQKADDPGSWPRGGWSADSWATALCALLLGDEVIGVAAIRAQPAATDIVDARVALALDARQVSYAKLLLDACVDLARAAGGGVVRLFAPSAAAWALDAAAEAGFMPVRSVFHMLLPRSVELPERMETPGVRVRSMHVGEESKVLAALNANWEGTWSFVPIPLEMLESDLEGQRDGMLLAVESADDSRIVATCHAVFDPTDLNPDGDPRAWISNLTVSPEYRGRGLGRAMLLAGVHYLRDRGAGSVTLGVDAGDPAPLRLYQSAGFETVSSTAAWDKRLGS